MNRTEAIETVEDIACDTFENAFSTADAIGKLVRHESGRMARCATEREWLRFRRAGAGIRLNRNERRAVWALRNECR